MAHPWFTPRKRKDVLRSLDLIGRIPKPKSAPTGRKRSR